MKNQEGMTSLKDHSNLLESKPKERDIYDLPDREFNKAVSRKLSV